MRARTTFRMYAVVWLALLSLLTGCDDLPRDPSNSLNNALERGTLRVGVLHSNPWAIWREDGLPGGLEGELVSAFAAELGISVDAVLAGEEQLFEALIEHELDVVIGGFSLDNPWISRVGFTNPYYISRFVIGTPPDQPSVENIDGREVTLRRHTGLASALERKGASVTAVDELRAANGLILAEEWELRGLGYEPTEVELRKREHVIALPAGENALLVSLEAFLSRRSNEDDLAARLREVAQP